MSLEIYSDYSAAFPDRVDDTSSRKWMGEGGPVVRGRRSGPTSIFEKAPWNPATLSRSSGHGNRGVGPACGSSNRRSILLADYRDLQ